MTKKSYLFTSESVSEGHPDKVSDRISDMVVDTYLAAEPLQSRVGCETLTTTNKVVLAGEVRGPKIEKGDLIVCAGIHGVGTVADSDVRAGTIIGKAIEAYDSDHIGTIEVAVGRN